MDSDDMVPKSDFNEDLIHPMRKSVKNKDEHASNNEKTINSLESKLDIKELESSKGVKQVPNEINRDKLMEIVEKYSFRRRIGSNGEKKAVKMTFRDFKNMGLEPMRENFVCSVFYSDYLLPIVMLGITIVSFVTLITQIIYPDLSFFCNLIFILYFLGSAEIMLSKNAHPHKVNTSRTYQTSNVFAFVPSKNFTNQCPNMNHPAIFAEYDDDLDFEELDESDDEDLTYIQKFKKRRQLRAFKPNEKPLYGDIILSAHIDSKSQTFTTVVRIKFFRNIIIIMGSLFLLSFILYILGFFFPEQVQPIVNIVNILICSDLAGITLFLWLNRSGNNSKGALDNASGMAVVFGLADYFKDKPLKNFNLWFCQFNVEESGQMGARNWLLKRIKHFTRGRTFNINFDMVGCKEDKAVNICEFHGMYAKPVDPFLTNYIRKSAEELGIAIYGFNLPTGARTDRRVFTMYGYNGIDFASRNAGVYTHSREDTPDKV